MSRFALQLLLLLATSTTITVQPFSFAPQLQIHSSPVFSYRSPSELNLFRRSKGQVEHYESENSGKSGSRPYNNNRGGVVGKGVKRLVTGWNKNSPKSSKTGDRHAWKQKKNYPGANREYPGFLKSAIYRYRGMKQKIRYLFNRNTVYVLECENDKYYVGSTSNRKRRYREHFESLRGGSKWTKMHKPIRVIAEYKRIPSRYLMGVESQKTAETMIEHGVNNVRGASYCLSRNFTTSDLSSLTGFLGHYNQLDYKELSQELRKVLPRPDPTEWSFPPPARNTYGAKNSNKNKSYSTSKRVDDDNNGPSTKRPNRRKLRKAKTKERALNKDKAKCYNCGQTGHWANECPNDKSSARIDKSTSFEDSLDEWVSDSFLDAPSSKPSISVPESTAPKGSPNIDKDKQFEDILEGFFLSDSTSSKSPRSTSVSTDSDGDISDTNAADDTGNRLLE